MKNLTSLAAFAALAACSFSIARADTSDEPRSAMVRFADLDTASAQGAAVLYRRIKSAAESVCKELAPDRQLGLMQAYTNCMQTAIGHAVAKVDRPAVTAYAAAHGTVPGDANIRIASSK